MEAHTFTVNVSQEMLDDLDDRLRRTRWPDELAGVGWDLGVPVGYMQELVDYWSNDFNWRAQERLINSFPNFYIEVEGMGIHFVYERGNGPSPMPLILTHGWPSSFYEMLEIIPRLTDPARFGGDPTDAFDVVVPSVPGHGFSARPTERGFEDRQVGHLWVKLMEGLGYDRFAAHGYDLGASITSLLCLDYPERIIGYHTTQPGNPGPYLGGDAPPLTDSERSWIEQRQEWWSDERGYAQIQGTRPQTLAYGLNDSPAGLAAWIVEKWHVWTVDRGESLDGHFSKDELITNVMIYWVTETVNSAARYYSEELRLPGLDDRITVPTGVALPTRASERPPREYIERLHTDIRHWVELPRGGHFVALEEPDLVAESIKSFFGTLR